MEKIVNHQSLQALKKEGSPVIIAAAVKEAEAIFNACRDNGVIVTAFCDSEKRKENDLFCKLKVIHTPTLPKHYSKARFIIATQQVQDVTEQLSTLGYNEFYSGLELLENYEVDKHKYSISNPYMKTRLSVYKKSHEIYFQEDKTYMRSIDVMITTKCSLKCRNCSNLMQYYANPKDTDHQKILSALDILSNNVDHISEFRVIGGEPLMNKGWAHIVNGISEKNSDRKIFIYTNGTIAPKDEQLKSFDGKNVKFIITD